nr:MAG TPA: hypothetical protein [Caudoviricetes sp.]
MNIAKILKDKPAGTKLYSVANGLVTIEKKIEYNLKHPECSTIWCNSKFSGSLLHFTYDGKSEASGECLLFPSKTMRNWKKVAWRKGDVLINKDINGNSLEVLFDHFKGDDYSTFIGRNLISTDNKLNVEYITDKDTFLTNEFTREHEEDAEFYINSLGEVLENKLKSKPQKK